MANIILIGFMGAGKTTFGKWLAKEKNMDFRDTDALIEEEEGITVNKIFETKGEHCFRELETGLLERFVRVHSDNLVLSAGGGMPMREINRRLLKELGCVVYLRASVDTLCKRLEGDGTRPLLQGGGLRERINTLMAQRAQVYESASSLIIDTDNRTFEDILKRMEELQ